MVLRRLSPSFGSDAFWGERFEICEIQYPPKKNVNPRVVKWLLQTNTMNRLNAVASFFFLTSEAFLSILFDFQMINHLNWNQIVKEITQIRRVNDVQQLASCSSISFNETSEFRYSLESILSDSSNNGKNKWRKCKWWWQRERCKKFKLI